MELDDVFTIEAQWKRFRYLLSDGRTIDVVSPYNAGSGDRTAVLVEAGRRFGPDNQRKIEGVATLPDDD